MIEPVVQQIMQTFQQAGYQVYLVGGYVRDTLLGRQSHDIDLASDATPESVQALFPKTIATGIAFGTVTICVAEQQFEVTTFRHDIGSRNHRKPGHVTYATSLAVDVKRRDFTINGLAMDATGQIIDYVGGQADLAAGVIRAIGDPVSRFHEDALRMLRAVRFAQRFKFTIEPQTAQAIQTCAPYVRAIARERLRQEWRAILFAPEYQVSPELVVLAQVCFGAYWERVLNWPLQGGDERTLFAYLYAVGETGWPYEKKEKQLAQRAINSQTQPPSCCFIGLTALEVAAILRLLADLAPEHVNAYVNAYARYEVKTLAELAITASECQQRGYVGPQIRQALFLCVQAINEQKIANEANACWRYLEEEFYGKSISPNLN